MSVILVITKAYTSTSSRKISTLSPRESQRKFKGEGVEQKFFKKIWGLTGISRGVGNLWDEIWIYFLESQVYVDAFFILYHFYQLWSTINTNWFNAKCLHDDSERCKNILLLLIQVHLLSILLSVFSLFWSSVLMLF